MSFRFEINELEHAIDTLFVVFPELKDDERLRADVLEGETDLHSVMSRLLEKQQEAAYMVEALDAREKTIKARKDRYGRQDEAMRSIMLKLMEKAGARSLVLTEATLSMRNIPPGVQILNESEIPEELTVVKRSPDRKAIKAALDAGQTVRGATLSNGSISLTVRAK